MIQCGGFEPGMSQKETNANIENEATNGLKNREGSIAMARTSDPHSASSQFFINGADNAFLDHRAPSPDGWGYAVFGRVADGFEVVKRINAASTGSKGGHQDVPVDDILIETAEIAPE
jgi:peptidyl-prolyl cis-trans isomerase B (cyclophilin B)